MKQENVEQDIEEVEVPTDLMGKEEPSNISSEEEVEEVEVNLDDLDSVPKSEKYRIITVEDQKEKRIPQIMTISNVKLGRALTKDKEGKFIAPETNNNGNNYYKAKLIVELKEEITGDKIRTFIPSIFYSVDEDGEVAKIPTIPYNCSDDKLNDNFTSGISKVRNKFCKFKNIDPKTLSSSQFSKGLIGMRFVTEVESGSYKNKPWVKLSIKEFCA